MVGAVPRLYYIIFSSRVGGSLRGNLILLQLLVALASCFLEPSIEPYT